MKYLLFISLVLASCGGGASSTSDVTGALTSGLWVSSGSEGRGEYWRFSLDGTAGFYVSDVLVILGRYRVSGNAIDWYKWSPDYNHCSVSNRPNSEENCAHWESKTCTLQNDEITCEGSASKILHVN